MQSVNQIKITYPTGIYPIFIGAKLLAKATSLAAIKNGYAVVTDDRVGPLYARQLNGAIGVVTVPAGEKYKNLDTVQMIYQELFGLGLDRKSTLIALGGGVVGDMAGFVAATYLRGIDFVQCPTTLLAMVDASVGGKTGVDMPQGKNLVGAFKQPTAVVADISTLLTLPAQEVSNGMAEVIKHGLINNKGLFEKIEQAGLDMIMGTKLNGPEPPLSPEFNLQSLISTAIQVKKEVVEADPFEHGRRATLNLGHTFGHAIELVTRFSVRHGQGVAMGLVCAARLSATLGYCDSQLQSRIEGALSNVNLPTRIPAAIDSEALYQAMKTDKKKSAGKLRFVLPKRIGEVVIVSDVPKAAVMATIKALQV